LTQAGRDMVPSGLALNLTIVLGRGRQRVVLVDADLGLARIEWLVHETPRRIRRWAHSLWARKHRKPSPRGFRAPLGRLGTRLNR
jgi:hypothetical protein